MEGIINLWEIIKALIKYLIIAIRTINLIPNFGIKQAIPIMIKSEGIIKIIGIFALIYIIIRQIIKR